MTLALAAQRAEHEVVGAPVGVMDQAVSLLAEPETALFLDCRSLVSRPVPFRPSAAGLALLVIDTHVRHAHATGEYAARRRECERAAAALGLTSLRDATLDQVDLLDGALRSRARHVVTENARVQAAVDALLAGDVAALGPLLWQSHDSLRDDFAVSVPELDTAVAAAGETGALGARMTGGGFGGCAIALVRERGRPMVTEGVLRAFASAGFAQPDVFAVQPSGGARRVEVA
jgi:galactokinase